MSDEIHKSVINVSNFKNMSYKCHLHFHKTIIKLSFISEMTVFGHISGWGFKHIQEYVQHSTFFYYLLAR